MPPDPGAGEDTTEGEGGCGPFPDILPSILLHTQIGGEDGASCATAAGEGQGDAAAGGAAAAVAGGTSAGHLLDDLISPVAVTALPEPMACCGSAPAARVGSCAPAPAQCA